MRTLLNKKILKIFWSIQMQVTDHVDSEGAFIRLRSNQQPKKILFFMKSNVNIFS